MSFDPSLEEQELLADAMERAHSQMTRRELVVGLIAGALFCAAAAAIWISSPPAHFAVEPALLCLGVLIVASSVSLDTPLGFTVLTQLAFVPLIFSVPPAVVPVAVAVSFMLAKVPSVLKGDAPLVRLVQVPGNSWFSIGPAAVFAIAAVEPAQAGTALLLAALLAEFLLDFAVSTVRFAYAGDAKLSIQLRETWVYAVDAGLSGIGWAIAVEVQSKPGAVLVMLPLLGLLGVFAHERRQRLESLVELNSAYRGTALVLGDVVEADDGYTGEHCKSVVALALEVGEKLGLDADQRRNLEFAALLHDVGKIAVPKEIVNKPGKLSAEEWTIIKTHTVEGEKMLARVGGFMRQVGEIVRSHHERWDGAGYPDGLAGESIPLEARIITCCDSWNAMRTNRSYRQALAFEVAVAEMQAHAGTQFDPAVVEALIECVQSEGETATADRREERPAKLSAPLRQSAEGQSA
jgi:putative nucleotidyltransferase with HDIG domain